MVLTPSGRTLRRHRTVPSMRRISRDCTTQRTVPRVKQCTIQSPYPFRMGNTTQLDSLPIAEQAESRRPQVGRDAGALAQIRTRRASRKVGPNGYRCRRFQT